VHYFLQLPGTGRIGDQGTVCRCLAEPGGVIRHALNRQMAKKIGVILALQWSLSPAKDGKWMGLSEIEPELADLLETADDEPTDRNGLSRGFVVVLHRYSVLRVGRTSLRHVKFPILLSADRKSGTSHHTFSSRLLHSTGKYLSGCLALCDA
jgi:hypothetical protein